MHLPARLRNATMLIVIIAVAVVALRISIPHEWRATNFDGAAQAARSTTALPRQSKARRSKPTIPPCSRPTNRKPRPGRTLKLSPLLRNACGY